MKIRIAFGLDLTIHDLTLEDHERKIRRVAEEIEKFYAADLDAPTGWTLKTVNATAVLEVTFPSGRQPRDLHVFGCFLPRFDIYRWINISKEG